MRTATYTWTVTAPDALLSLCVLVAMCAALLTAVFAARRSSRWKTSGLVTTILFTVTVLVGVYGDFPMTDDTSQINAALAESGWTLAEGHSVPIVGDIAVESLSGGSFTLCTATPDGAVDARPWSVHRTVQITVSCPSVSA